MKHNSKQFLALFMAVSMAVAPVSGVYAEDQNAAVEDTLSENKQDNDEAGQTESSVTTDTSQEVTKEAGKNLIEKEILNVPNEKTRGILKQNLENIKSGQRDFRF